MPSTNSERGDLRFEVENQFFHKKNGSRLDKSTQLASAEVNCAWHNGVPLRIWTRSMD
jgi:hypothetical protein